MLAIVWCVTQTVNGTVRVNRSGPRFPMETRRLKLRIVNPYALKTSTVLAPKPDGLTLASR